MSKYFQIKLIINLVNMIKKIILILFLFFLWFSLNAFASNCSYSEGDSISNNIENCIKDSWVYISQTDLKAEWWLKKEISKWVSKIALYLWIFAVFAIVYSAFLLIISVWEEEKVTKAKNILKWSIIWLIWVMFASSIIALIINTYYGFAK